MVAIIDEKCLAVLSDILATFQTVIPSQPKTLSVLALKSSGEDRRSLRRSLDTALALMPFYLTKKPMCAVKVFDPGFALCAAELGCYCSMVTQKMAHIMKVYPSVLESVERNGSIILSHAFDLYRELLDMNMLDSIAVHFVSLLINMSNILFAALSEQGKQKMVNCWVKHTVTIELLKNKSSFLEVQLMAQAIHFGGGDEYLYRMKDDGLFSREISQLMCYTSRDVHQMRLVSQGVVPCCHSTDKEYKKMIKYIIYRLKDLKSSSAVMTAARLYRLKYGVKRIDVLNDASLKDIERTIFNAVDFFDAEAGSAKLTACEIKKIMSKIA